MEAVTAEKHFFTNLYTRKEQKTDKRLQIYYVYAEDGQQTYSDCLKCI